MNKCLALLAALCLVLSAAACGQTAAPGGEAAPAELTVFAAASLEESLNHVIAAYEASHGGVAVTATYDSSGTLKTQIENGAACDVFLSAAPRQMDALDGGLKGDAERNPDALDFVLSQTRLDLLENKVVLAVPEGNPKGVESFDGLAELLEKGEVLLAMGNSDVPVGQYTQNIFRYYGLDEAALAAAGTLTYGSNVKEVATQVAEGAVDCGVIYATDACSAGLTVADEAAAEMCGRVIYPAAVMKCGANPEAAQDFLDYLSSPEAGALFAAVGFSPAGGTLAQ